MDEIDQILSFCVHLGSMMLRSGANLERVEDTIHAVLNAYGLNEISLFLLNTHFIISIVDNEGHSHSRQITIPPDGIHLDRLRRLRKLYRNVIMNKPSPALLSDLLKQTIDESQNYSNLQRLAGYCLALLCLARIFGAGWSELPVVLVITCIQFFTLRLFSRPGINRIITNIICMFFAGTIAALSSRMGFCHNEPAVVITASFMLIPGIPLVNSVRNLLCGNEMNGILSLFKVIVETSSIILGLTLSAVLFGMVII